MRLLSRLPIFIVFVTVLAAGTVAAQDMEWLEGKGPEGGGPVDLASDSITGNFYAATLSGGVFISTDDGATWKGSNEGLPCLSTRRVMVGRDGTVFVFVVGARGVKGGLYRSTDHGDSWSYADLPYRWNENTMFCISPNGTLYTHDGDSMTFRSTDHGTTWEQAGPFIPMTTYNGVDIAVDAQERIVVMPYGIKDNVALVFEGTWRFVALGKKSRLIQEVEAFGDYILAATKTGVYRSSDGGSKLGQHDHRGVRGIGNLQFQGAERGDLRIDLPRHPQVDGERGDVEFVSQQMASIDGEHTRKECRALR